MTVKNVDLTRLAQLEQTSPTGSQNAVDNIDSEINGLLAGEGVEGKTSEEIQKEIEQLEKERAANIKKMQKLQEEIKGLVKKAEDLVDEAAEAQGKIAQETKDKSKKVVNEQVQKYIAANKEKSGSMTQAQLSENISKNIPDPNFGAAVAKLLEASGIMDEVDYCLGALDSLITDTDYLDFQLEAANEEFNAAKEAEEAAAEAEECTPPPSCDPIGFMAEDENGKMAQFDFIKDGDGDGEFNSTDDFLGAQDQWNEMKAADANNDGTVSAKELDDAGIQVIKNKDGKSAKSITEQFGEKFSIKLDSYKTGGEYAGITDVENNDHDNDGVKNQDLLGTFKVTLGKDEAGDDITADGYNTLDDVDFLQSEYGVEAGEIEQQTKDNIFASDIQGFVEFVNEMTTKKVPELNQKIDEGLAGINVEKLQTEEFQSLYKRQSEANAQIKVDEIKAEVDAEIAAEEAETVGEEKAAEATEETKVTETAEEEKATGADKEGKKKKEDKKA